MKKKLGVCGDSFMSAISYDKNDIDNGYDNHFTEILAKKLDWNVITFARGACSNQTIRLQIDEIIKEKPDCVIIGLTSPDRIEFPVNNLYEEEYYKKFENYYSYNRKDGLYNIDYKGYPDKSSNNIKFNEVEPKLISETINNIFVNNTNSKLSSDDKIILEKWFQRFFDFRWKIQQDSWIISNGLRTLLDNNIKFFCINHFIDAADLNFFGESIIHQKTNLDPKIYFNPNKNVKYRFHTSLEDQNILAELWYDLFVKNNLL